MMLNVQEIDYGPHTPAPWRATTYSRGWGDSAEIGYIITGGGGREVARLPIKSDRDDVRTGQPGADARRIVAAVNAVEGIPTDALEDGAVQELLAAAEAARDTLAEIENGVDPDSFPEQYDRVRLMEAIAKARGEQ